MGYAKNVSSTKDPAHLPKADKINSFLMVERLIYLTSSDLYKYEKRGKLL